MDKYQFIRVSFVLRPTSSHWSNKVAPMNYPEQYQRNAKQWIPNEQNRASTISFYENSNTEIAKNNKKNCSKFSFISIILLLTLLVLAAVGVSIYGLIRINQITTTSTTATTTTTTTTTTVTTTSTTSTTTTSLAAQCYSYIIINDATRLATATSGSLCDTSLFTSTVTWVCFNGTGGTEITRTPTSPYTCGTQATGWYISAMPSPSITVTGTICYAWSTSTCYFSNTIYVTNCGSFYVYGLVDPPACDMRYCTV